MLRVTPSARRFFTASAQEKQQIYHKRAKKQPREHFGKIFGFTIPPSRFASHLPLHKGGIWGADLRRRSDFDAPMSKVTHAGAGCRGRHPLRAYTQPHCATRSAFRPPPSAVRHVSPDLPFHFLFTSIMLHARHFDVDTRVLAAVFLFLFPFTGSASHPCAKFIYFKRFSSQI